MANFSSTPSCSSSNPVPETNNRSDLNGNAENGVETRENSSNSLTVSNLTTGNESHGGARPKVRRPVDVARTTNGRNVGTSYEEDQKVPTFAASAFESFGRLSPNLDELDSDIDDPTNQVLTCHVRDHS